MRRGAFAGRDVRVSRRSTGKESAMAYTDEIRRLIAETEDQLARPVVLPIRIGLAARLAELNAILVREEAAEPPPPAAPALRAGQGAGWPWHSGSGLP